MRPCECRSQTSKFREIVTCEVWSEGSVGAEKSLSIGFQTSFMTKVNHTLKHVFPTSIVTKSWLSCLRSPFKMDCSDWKWKGFRSWGKFSQWELYQPFHCLLQLYPFFFLNPPSWLVYNLYIHRVCSWQEFWKVVSSCQTVMFPWRSFIWLMRSTIIVGLNQKLKWSEVAYTSRLICVMAHTSLFWAPRTVAPSIFRVQCSNWVDSISNNAIGGKPMCCCRSLSARWAAIYSFGEVGSSPGPWYL